MCPSRQPKYLAGHSDVMAGIVTASNEEVWKTSKTTSAYLGMCLGGDDAYLTSRGIRTLDVRLEQHQASGLKLAEWFKAQPEVERVLHLPSPNALVTIPGNGILQVHLGYLGSFLKISPIIHYQSCSTIWSSSAWDLVGVGLRAC